jgi:hypothetical protein
MEATGVLVRLEDMSFDQSLDEVALARAIAALPVAPEAWVLAAELLPLIQDDLDALAERCREDAQLRERVIEGLEAALRSAHEPTRRAAGDIHDRLRPES